MEFMNRGSRPAQHSGAPNQNNTTSVGSGNSHTPRGSGFKNLVGLKVASIALLVSITVLIGALLWFVATGKPNNEAKHVDSGKLQAVFLNGGQVYFGQIQELNNRYLRLSNIYYLRVNQQVQPDRQDDEANANDISLVKLGCELHGPEDEMLINREQVVFWENLKDNGQVTEAVKEYRRNNPNGQNCEQSQQQSTEESNREDNNDGSDQ